VAAETLSIVVTCYNLDRLGDVYELLDSIKNQTYPNIETVFVAERSAHIRSQVTAYIQKHAIPNIKVLFNDGDIGLSAARNLGIKESKGEFIAFVDDDTILPPDWADEMVKAYADDSVIGITGPALPQWEDESAASWFPQELLWLLSCTGWSDWDEIREVRNAWGQGMSFRREAFDNCGGFLNEFGFHKGSMAEDNEFSFRVRRCTGKRILYYPSVTLWHKVHIYRLSLRFIRARAYWIGYSRRALRQVCQNSISGENLLSPEYNLLRRIVSRLIPGILGTFFTNPVAAWRKTRVTIVALAFVTLGYYSHLLPWWRNSPK